MMGLRRIVFALASLAILATASCLHAQSLGKPVLPATTYDYVDYAVDSLPAHFGDGAFGTVTSHDNTPAGNPITNPGATLGRVLFYDKRLSHNNTTSCASCHHQSAGFSDPAPQSTGANGDLTPRHSMGLTNAKFYDRGKFLSDEAADTLEDQILMPIENPIEMDMDLATLNNKLAATSYYPDLFNDAFGSPDVTSERISLAVAQFIRSMVSYESKFDSAFNENGGPNFAETLTPQEIQGHDLFNGTARCSFCHVSRGQVAGDIHNNGLDAVTTDPGAGNGKFKAPSLRNIEVRGAYMHDGRFTSLEEVVDFYSTGVQDNPDLDFRLRDDQNGNVPFNPNFSQEEKDALVAFLRTLTDSNFLTNPIFSDPFVLACDFDGDEICDVGDLNLLLKEGPVADGVSVTPELVPYDLNGDGILDNADVAAWLSDAGMANGFSGSYLVGDANLDGTVDTLDLNSWLQNRFTATTSWSEGDFNGDGVADLADLHLWNSLKFSSVPPFSFVPEPDGPMITLVTAAMLLSYCRCRRRRRN